jgi:hypothetical protein
MNKVGFVRAMKKAPTMNLKYNISGDKLADNSRKSTSQQNFHKQQQAATATSLTCMPFIP